jgi:hypothetical protein
MRIFISYSTKDKGRVLRIADRLQQDGHSILQIDPFNLEPGDNWVEKNQTILAESDVFIVVISENSLRSEKVSKEFTGIALQQISKRQQRIIPVRIDRCPVPSYLADRLYVDLSHDFDSGLNKLSEILKTSTLDQISSPANRSPASPESRESHINRLHESLRRGSLTLICGAGVSVGAGIPAWGELLLRLLKTLMEKMSISHNLDLGHKAAEDFQRRYGASSLILGKYLKNNLGRDFPAEVRNALYINNPISCPLIDSIVDLSRPKRDSRPLDSIITFNFDALIEEQLTASCITNKPIFSESIRHDQDQLPVYHVHGYLPRTGEIPTESELVFSEDAYHSQFIEPYSWSNLIQLNKLTQNTCLFVGVSLTDPNMRRLLDVAWRKNPYKTVGHYILKILPKFEDKDMLDEVTRLLEEQDANALGLNVIWINTYDEIPQILRQVAATRNTMQV